MTVQRPEVAMPAAQVLEEWLRWWHEADLVRYKHDGSFWACKTCGDTRVFLDWVHTELLYPNFPSLKETRIAS